MITKKIFLAVASLSFFFLVFGFQASSEHKILFEKAKFTMETKGDLEGAIKLFREIIEKYSGEREYAAKSYFFIGQCYEKLGREEAKKAYQRVIEEFADQKEIVVEARARLFELERLTAAEPKGIMVRQVWADPYVDYYGAPSPDGVHLACVDWETGDLAIYETATGKKRRLTNKGTWEESQAFALVPRWSPDGKLIVYSWYGDNAENTGLRIIGLDGSGPRVLCKADVEPGNWSPDGKHILVNFFEEGKGHKIALVSVEDGSMRILKDIGQSLIDGYFSPDGRYMVYSLPPDKETQNCDIFMLTTDGFREYPLVEHHAHDYALGWSPDGRYVLFRSDRTGTHDAWVIPVADGKPEGDPLRVKKDMGAVYPMGFTRDGSYYYGIGTGMTDIYVTTLNPVTGEIMGAPEKQILRFTGSNGSPNWSPDGKYLAYTSARHHVSYNGSGRAPVLCIRSLETGKEREFSPNMKGYGAVQWSSDGSSIFIWGEELGGGGRGIYAIDVQAGDVRQIMRTDMIMAWMPTYACSHDGKSIFYRFDDRETRLARIMRRDIATNEEKELYRQSSPGTLSMFKLSPDGQWLAFREGRFLNVMPSAGGIPRKLFGAEDKESITSIAWMPDGREIFFVKELPDPEERKSELWRIAARGGDPTKTGLVMKMGNLSIHPDGRRIAFTSGHYAPEIWVMENFLPESKTK